LAAADSLRQALGSPLSPAEQQEHDQHVAAVGDALGREALTAAGEAARAMTWEEAVVRALREGGSP
jgi:hypothetical protein